LKEAKARRRRAIKQFLIVALCFATLLCLGGIAAGFYFYDRATKPDLSSPVLVTHRYISAFLIDRDDRAAERFQCANPSGLHEVKALRDENDNNQRTQGVSYAYGIGGVTESDRSGDTAHLSVVLMVSMNSQRQQKPLHEQEHWEFTAHNENGWRVCGAHELD
jgi:hypothetical protein